MMERRENEYNWDYYILHFTWKSYITLRIASLKYYYKIILNISSYIYKVVSQSNQIIRDRRTWEFGNIDKLDVGLEFSWTWSDGDISSLRLCQFNLLRWEAKEAGDVTIADLNCIFPISILMKMIGEIFQLPSRHLLPRQREGGGLRGEYSGVHWLLAY